MSAPTPAPSQDSGAQDSARSQPTRWDLDEVAVGYEQWDNTICWVFGYPFVFRALGLGSVPVDKVLDLGCGPGIVTEHIARSYDVAALGRMPRRRWCALPASSTRIPASSTG